MKIYNSISRQKDEFVPVTPGHVGMYVCGPTVYGPPHLGHARSYINFDVVRRTFTELGYKVKYVQNITDVGHIVGDIDDGEDKIIRQAKLEELDPYEIAYKYECDYFDKMDKLGVLRPSISCRATGFIPDIIEMIQKLINRVMSIFLFAHTRAMANFQDVSLMKMCRVRELRLLVTKENLTTLRFGKKRPVDTL